MFCIEEINPEQYRTKSRNATLVMMAIFIVIGFIGASTSVHYLSEYNSNKIVLNLIGAFAGLLITAWIVYKFLADKPFMYESMYGVRLKRHLMYVSNKLRPIQEAAENGDCNAMKCLRFYHLGLTQMNTFDNNSSANIDLKKEKDALVEKMQALNLDLNQTCLDPEWTESYSNDIED
jgi:hypothetical protein